jgi:CRP/FNR family transcriptional regulator, polysaccharide utilization system transcription regulator
MKLTEIPNCISCPSFNASTLQNLSSCEIENFEAAKSCSTFKKGQIILHEGNRTQGVYCIHKGKVKITRMGPEGKDQIIRFAKDGDLLGYRSLLSGENLSASMVALEDTSVCFMPKTMMFEFIETNPKFSLDLMKLACHDLGEAGKLITNMAQKNVRERLAEILLLLKNIFGEDEEGFLNITLTREEYANMVGTATETVIRLLSDFKSQNLIEAKGRKMKILLPNDLVRIGNVYD